MPKKHPIIWTKFISHAECNRIPTRYSYQKLKLPHCKTNQSLIGPLFWNNQDNFWETSASSNAFKHNIKDYYFRKGN